MQGVVRAYFAVVNCFKPGHIPPICIGALSSHLTGPGHVLTPQCVFVLNADDLAVGGALKSAYRRFKRLGKVDKHGKVDVAGLARALRVKDTPFLRKLMQCWDRDGVRRVAVLLSSACVWTD